MRRLYRFHRTGTLLAACLAASVIWSGCGAPSARPSARKDSGAANPHAEHAAGGPATGAAAQPTPRVPAFFANLDEARPLPKVLDPRQFTSPAVVKAYQNATEIPEIFAQQPCYCYCDDGEKHKSLLDCYATTHSVG